MTGQQLEQHAVEAGGEQANVDVVDQVPEVGPLAQRDEQKEVVDEHREQHAIEGAIDAHEVFLGGCAGSKGAEKQGYEDGAGGVHPQQHLVAARGQLQGEPEVADLHRALHEGEAVTTLLSLELAVGLGQVNVNLVEQGVVDLQVAVQRLRAAVDQ